MAVGNWKKVRGTGYRYRRATSGHGSRPLGRGLVASTPERLGDGECAPTKGGGRKGIGGGIAGG